LENPKIQIEVDGEVVRTNTEGIGVRFKRGYKIAPVEQKS
jgi:hypothetical protein